MTWNKFLVKKIFLFVVMIIAIITNSCTIGGKSWSMGYKMQAVNISSDIKICGVNQFQNKAPIISPMLANDMTEMFRDKILSQTSLRITNGLNGDVNFNCVITDYSTIPISPQAGAQIIAASNRLTISVHATYTNSKDPKSDFEKDFSTSYDFPATMSMSNVEQSDEFKKKLEELITNIFNQAFVNW